MDWIFYSLIYAIFNAIYLNYNENYHFNGYILGMIRGFGIFIFSLPFLLIYNFNLESDYIFLLIIQGILIGIYDSHIFFASSLYGGHSTSGFMATSVIVTLIGWWWLEFSDLEKMLFYKTKLLSLCFIIMGLTVSYWQMMKVHINSKAEIYLYPAVFSLSFMSIATRYIALAYKSPYQGIILYLTISCFVSGIYNLVMFLYFIIRNKGQYTNNTPSFSSMAWLIFFSFVLIVAKTLAFRVAYNPTYVVALLLLSPIFADIIKNKALNFKFEEAIFLIFIVLLIIFSFY